MGDREKLMCNFHGSWFLTLEFPKVCQDFAEFGKILQNENLLSPEFLTAKSQI